MEHGLYLKRSRAYNHLVSEQHSVMSKHYIIAFIHNELGCGLSNLLSFNHTLYHNTSLTDMMIYFIKFP